MKVRTFSLGAGADTVVFGADKDANGVDEITGFTAGARGDVLAIGSGASVNGLLGEAFGGTSKFTTKSGSGDIQDKQVLIHTGSAAITNFSTNFATTSSSDKYQISSSQKLFVVDTVNNNNTLYLVDGSSSGSITKVGTLNANTAIASSLTSDNFGNVA